jgi:hypothetical protein
MLTVKTTDIALGAAMPFKAYTLTWLQLNELTNNLFIMQTLTNGQSSSYFICWGLKNTIVGAVNTITSGVVYCQGVFYNVIGATITLGVGESVYLNLSETFTQISAAADPVTFSDGTTHNVYAESKLVLANATSGTVAYNSLVKMGTFTEQAYNAANLVAATGTWAVPTPANFKVSTSPYAFTRTININIQSSTISNDTANVKLLINNVVFSKDFYGTLFYSNTINAVPKGLAYAKCISGTNEIEIKLFDNANIKNTGGSPLFDIVGQITVEVD